jgi:hypothetical protein
VSSPQQTCWSSSQARGSTDEKLDAYVNAWRTAGTQHGWSRFPRVLYAIGTLSRFPSDAMLLFREVEAAIRRQPADARPLFALTRYEEAVPVRGDAHTSLTGRRLRSWLEAPLRRRGRVHGRVRSAPGCYSPARRRCHDLHVVRHGHFWFPGGAALGGR